MAEKYVSNEDEWNSLAASADNLAAFFQYGSVKRVFQMLEDKIRENGLSGMYAMSSGKYSANIAAAAEQAMWEAVEALRSIHRNGAGVRRLESDAAGDRRAGNAEQGECGRQCIHIIQHYSAGEQRVLR